MLQRLTIKTENRRVLKPLVESALENERKLIQMGIQQTKARLAEFEKKYKISTDEFEQRLHANKLDESVEFSDWRMEIGMLQILDSQYKTLLDARLD
jgi:hypothetical protein